LVSISQKFLNRLGRTFGLLELGHFDSRA
jgi:hypothetical protein